MVAKYLYGIIRYPGAVSFGPIGLPVGEEEVYVVGRDGIGAVVSNYRGPQLGELPRHELFRHLVLHQKVIETVMQRHTVLPAKFGTVLPNGVELRRALGCGKRELPKALERFEGLLQYEVAATWDLGQLFAEIAAEPAVVSLRAAADSVSSEGSLELRLKAGAMVKDSLDRRREELCRQLTSILSEHALDHQANALRGDDMVMNEAFLIARASQEDFAEHLHRVDLRFDGKLRIRCVGPLPPYSFGTVEVLRPDPESVYAAAQLLGLGDRISVAAVRRAYRERAARLHPDVNPSPEAAEPFSRLRDAEGLLVTYCRGKVEGNGSSEARSCYISRDEVEGTYLVAVKRSNE